MSASYFDIDGTLLDANLLGPTLYYLRNQAHSLASLRMLGRALLRAPAMLHAEWKDRRAFNEVLFEVWEGMTEDRLLLLADDAYEDLRDAVYPEARALVTRAREAGEEVVLVTGGLDFLARRVAEDLGAHTVIANRLEIDRGRATGRLLPPVVAGPEKARLVRRHALERGYDLERCRAYSDSASDVPMLSMVGRPTAVNPDAGLARLARAHAWPVLRFSR